MLTPVAPNPSTQPNEICLLYESFVMSTDVTGVVWRDPDGWRGCLRTAVEGDTNFVGPFISRVGARLAVLSEFTAAVSATPRDTPIVRGL